LKAREAECAKECDRKRKQLDVENANVARSAQKTNELLKAVWLKQVTESQVLINFWRTRTSRPRWLMWRFRTISRKRERLSRRIV
jgi:hypothetical protein